MVLSLSNQLDALDKTASFWAYMSILPFFLAVLAGYKASQFRKDEHVVLVVRMKNFRLGMCNFHIAFLTALVWTGLLALTALNCQLTQKSFCELHKHWIELKTAHNK